MLLYDTNVIIYITADSSRVQRVRSFVNPNKQAEYMSLVSFAELRSFAFQRKWEAKRLERLEAIVAEILIINLDLEEIIEKYIEIDSFSRNMHPNYSPIKSPITMGKNDLWIASTACFYNLEFITTDKDFNHLGGQFINLNKIDKKSLTSLV
jgi:tRNA(fMet)-specific endonuclease VapC